MPETRDGAPRPHARLLRIGTVVVDLRYSRMLRDGQEVPLPPRAFDLFALFLSRPGVLLARDDIFRLVWKDVFVEDANLTQTVWLLRRALGDDCKGWIRTVSKRGYVFEAPPIEVLDESEAAVIAEPAPVEPVLAETAPAPAPAIEPPPARLPSRRRRRGLAAVTTALLLGAALALAWFVWREPEKTAPSERLVVVESVVDGDETAHAATALAAEWIAWQLADLYRLDVSMAAVSTHIGVMNPAGSMLLVSARLDTRSQQVIIEARRIGRGAGDHWESAGAAGDLPQIVDALAKQVVAGVVPNIADPPVTLSVSPEAARAYVAAMGARRSGGGAATLAKFEEVVRLAPQFEPARLVLAENLADLGRIAAARDHVAALSAWIDTLPPRLRAIPAARRDEISQHYRSAASEYSALAEAYPGQLQFRLDAARNLLADDRVREALRMLDDESFENQPMPLRAQWQLLRANAQLRNGEAQAARVSALRAETMAVRDTLVQARAQMLAVRAGAAATARPPDIDAVRQAARLFDAAGDEFGALRAKALAAALDPATRNDAHAYLDALLVRARSAGNAAVETEALLDRARLALADDDFRTYRASLVEAHGVARMGNDAALQRRVDTELLYDDMQRGDYAAARRRSAAWPGTALRGATGVELGIVIAWFDIRLGDYPGALAAVDAIEDAAQNGDIEPTSAISGRLACVRAHVRLRQGALEEAWRQYAACADASTPRDRDIGRVGLATASLNSGDIDGARTRVDALLATPQTDAAGENLDALRKVFTIPLLQRMGRMAEASRLVDEVAAYAERADFRRLAWSAQLRRAELLLVERRIDAATAALRDARMLIPRDDWSDNAAAQLLEASIAIVRGDAAAAWPILARLSADARVRGDVVIQLGAMSLAGDDLAEIGSSKEARDALIMQSGMRGVSHRWLIDGAKSQPQ